MAATLVLAKHALPIFDLSKPASAWRLGPEGETQSHLLADRLRVFAPLRLVASPEPKALGTAQIASSDLGVDVSTADDLREFDRPVLPWMSKTDYELANAAIFADMERPALGAESGRAALDRFSAALLGELAQTTEESLVVVAHGTVISLFVGAHNDIDAFALWKQLTCPSFVVLGARSFSLREVVPLRP